MIVANRGELTGYFLNLKTLPNEEVEGCVDYGLNFSISVLCGLILLAFTFVKHQLHV